MTGRSDGAETQDTVSGLLKLFIIAVLSFHLKPSSFLVDLILQRPWDFPHPLSYRDHMDIMMTWPAQKTLKKKDMKTLLYIFCVNIDSDAADLFIFFKTSNTEDK